MQSVRLNLNSFTNIGLFLVSGNDSVFDSRSSVLSISGRPVFIFGISTQRGGQSRSHAVPSWTTSSPYFDDQAF
jgi:hypothetical protein